MPEKKATLLPSEWLTLEEAVRILGKSAKTLERLVRSGALASKLEPRAGRKAERLYEAAGVQKLKQEPPPRAAPQALTVRPKAETALAVPQDFLRDALGQFVNHRDRVGIREKLWLSIEEAGLYSGLCRNHLLRLCREEKLVAVKSPGWRIRRASLEAFAG